MRRGQTTIITILLVLILLVLSFIAFNSFITPKTTGNIIYTPQVERELDQKKPHNLSQEKEIINKEDSENKPELRKIESKEIQKVYETFEIYGNFNKSDSPHLLYNLEISDLDSDHEKDIPIIKFFPEKNYLGYDEIKQFFKENNIKLVVVEKGDDMEWATNFKRSVGISMIGHFGTSERSN